MAYLDVKSEVHHVAIMHDVFFPFDAHFACVFRALFAFAFDEIIEGDDFGANKAAFKVVVDDGGGFGGGVTFVDGSRADFFYASGEVSL